MKTSAAAPISQGQWSAWNSRSVPDVEQFRSGVWSIPIPIPDHPLRYTLCYVFTSDTKALVIDPGWESDEGWNALVAGLALAGLMPDAVEGIVVTHFHADHLGLGKRLVRESGAWLALGRAESAHRPNPDFVGFTRKKFSTWGVPDALMPAIEPDEAVHTMLDGLAVPDRWLDGDDVIQCAGSQLRVVATPGHSPGHICLVDEHHALLFTGDHVLPRISPNLPFDPLGLENPLKSYLGSLRDVQLGEHLEVCPGHEYRFGAIAERCAVLRSHSIERLDEVRHALKSQWRETVWDVARGLTWSRGWGSLSGISMRLALSETASHLRYLESLGENTRVKLVPGQVEEKHL